MRQFYTLSDFNFRDKRVLLRVDINCPLTKDTLRIFNDSRIRRIVPTVRELIGKQAKLVIIAHQGRKGGWDYTSLEQHAERLSKNLNYPVKYVDDVLGDAARKEIMELESSEVLMLGNVREIDSESIEKGMEEQAESEIVNALAPMFDYYVCDAFGAAHRSQSTLVGFEVKLPSASGRLMMKELFALSAIFDEPRRPSVFILGGAKFGDISYMIDHVLGTMTADTVILTGLAGNAFLYARGVNIGQASLDALKYELTEDNLAMAKSVLDKYGQRILLPVDIAVERNGERVSVNIGDLPTEEPALDIGDVSADKFRKVIESSKTSFMSGPAGMVEKEDFSIGTHVLMKAMIDSKGQSVIGGGHTGATAEKYNLSDSFAYTSTGGGALESFLMGKPLPVVEALKYSKAKFPK
ncbi:MAG TPA: phosphoglycerate kinase [Candidatus Methanomethylophilaceae archaeon]|nr:phosphoglycerate kinase [Candidatus Methanomethylophilaceae archaeon]